MRHRYKTLPLFLLAVALVVVGCDQSEQNVDPENANEYIITQENSAVGDGSAGTFAGSQQVFVPDTLSFRVQGFTIEKNYTWTVNDSEVPVEVSSDQSYVWEDRQGEFVSVMFTLDDGMTQVDQTAGSTTNTFAVNSPDDDIDPESLEITTVVPSIADQLARLPSGLTGGSFTQVDELGSSSGVGGFLTAGAPGGDQSYTVFAPTDEAVGALGAVPTQATDPDEPPTSSVRADLLKYHAVASKVGSGDLSTGSVGTLFGGQTIDVDVSGPVTINGSATVLGTDFPTLGNGFVHTIDEVLLPSTASADFTDRTTDPLDGGPTDPDTLEVDGSFIPDGGGFVVLHDSTSLADDGAITSIVGVSDYIAPNSVANSVEVPLDEAISDTTTVGAMPHEDTNDNQSYDFVTSGGAEDTPYTLEGAPVLDYAVINIE